MSSQDENQKPILQPIGDKHMKFDPVSKPMHYNQGSIEPIDFIEANGLLDFRLANPIKYIARCQYKGSEEQDLRKAIWYLERYLSEKLGCKK